MNLGNKGVHFIDLCEGQRAGSFTVVVLPSELQDVAGVPRLEGRTIEIHAAVELYEGRAEIFLKRISQLTGGPA